MCRRCLHRSALEGLPSNCDSRWTAHCSGIRGDGNGRFEWDLNWTGMERDSRLLVAALDKPEKPAVPSRASSERRYRIGVVGRNPGGPKLWVIPQATPTPDPSVSAPVGPESSQRLPVMPKL